MSTLHPSTFGTLLRRYRRAAGLTQEELAERARLSARAVSDLERGARRAPHSATVRLLVAALQLQAPERDTLAAAARQRAALVAPSAHAGGYPGSAAPPPFVGRARELALLDRHLAGAGPPVLLLAGEPGIGKSRLLQEASQPATLSGWRVLAGGCQRRGGQEPYAPLLQALERHIRIQSPAQLRTDLRGCAWLVRLLPELAAGPIEPLPTWTLTPDQERRLMVAAVARFLTNVAGPAGVVLVLDDLQWAGSDALDLLTALVRSAAEVPLRVIGAYRNTEVQPPRPHVESHPLSSTLADLAHAGLAVHRTLAPLTREEAAHLLDGLLGEMDGDPGVPREQVVQRAGGVPFFVVSYAQGLRAGAREDGAPDAVPWDVAQSVRQRVAALPSVAQEVLGVAAVVGREVPRPLLAGVATHPERTVVEAVDAACSARLLEEVGARAYRFVHDVIREVVEADLGAGRRALLHRQIAVALETAPGEPLVEALAYHYARAAEDAKAGLWLERAGDQAAAGFANAAALGHYTAARAHLDTAGADATALSRLDEKLGDLRLRLGAYAQAQEDFARARAAARDARQRAELGRKEGITWHRRGEFDHALAAFATAEAEGGADGAGTGLPGSCRAAIELSRGEALWSWGQYDAAQAAAERAQALLHAEKPCDATDHALARADYLQGRVAWIRGDTVRAEECHQRSLAIYERLGDQQGSAAAWSDLGMEAIRRGDLTQAEERGRRSLAIYERIGDQHGIGWACGYLFWFSLLRGDLTQAEEYARRELAINERSNTQRYTAPGWTDLAQVACARGDLAGAEESARRALAILERSEQQGGLGGSALSWNLLGTVAAQRGALTAAEECYRRSLDIMERLESSGFPGPISYAWHGLGRIACERGDLPVAAAWCRRARHLARRCGSIDVDALATLGLVRARLRGLPPAVRGRATTALLEQGCAAATRHGLALPTVDAALLSAEVHLRQGMLAGAQVAAEKALGLATGQQRRWEEAVARRLVGQCALAQGSPGDAEAHLRASLALLTEIGAALEAARTRLALAEALVQAAQSPRISEGARTLLAEAQAQFASSGAALDLAEAEQVVVAWRDR